MDQELTPRPEQIRAARGLLGWDQQILATKAGVALSEVEDFENGCNSPEPNSLVAIKRALEIAGALFTKTGATHGFHWTFMTEHGSSELIIEFIPEAAEPVIDFAAIFGKLEPPRVSINTVQRVTPELRKKVSDFVDRHSTDAPHLNRVRKMLADMADGESFLILPTVPSSTEEKLGYERLLYQLNHPQQQPIDENLEEFALLLQHYDLHMPRTDKRFDIGNTRKADRRCRFCNGTNESNARFDKEAHAIPAALGNKYLKLCDECDDCNQFFGNEIEPDLIELLNIPRVLLGTEVRGSMPTINFSGGKLFRDCEHGNLVVVSKSISEDASGSLYAELGTGKPIAPQNVYRSLAKIALSVIPEKELPKLSKTVRWVRYGEFASMPLPKVATAIVMLPADPSAQIALYIRKGRHLKMPHVVCEFRLGCYVFVYALPFSDLDEGDLIGFFEEEGFKQMFQHYALVPIWRQQDYSGIEKAQMNQRITLRPREGG